MPASVSSTSNLRGSSSKGELGAEGELAISAKLDKERRAAARLNADKALDISEERPSGSAGNDDAECVGESRPAKPKPDRRQNIGPHSKKSAVDDEETEKRKRK